MRTYLYSSGRGGVLLLGAAALFMCGMAVAIDLGMVPSSQNSDGNGTPATALAIPFCGTFAWVAIASRWICKVRLIGRRLEVVGFFGTSKSIDLDQPFTSREWQGNRASSLQIRQGNTKVSVMSYLDDFDEFRRIVSTAERASEEFEPRQVDLYGRTFYMTGPPTGWAVIALAALQAALLATNAPEQFWILMGASALVIVPLAAYSFLARFEVDELLQITQYDLFNRPKATLDLGRPFELRVDDFSTAATDLVATQGDQTIRISAANRRHDDLREGLRGLAKSHEAGTK